jgi:hypothetical protein
MIVFVANFIPLLMINYLILLDKSDKAWIGYTLLEIFILYLINYGELCF